MCRLYRESIILNREINRKIIEIIHKIKEILKPNKIILFGSFSRGDYNEYSDVDLVIVGNFKESFFDRIGIILDLNDSDLDIEPLVYTNEEFKMMMKNENRFILHVLEEGIEL
ncbi:MAG: nucleotidyltransferase domain-containing protein [Candidatus Helarchaeota archaeon]